MKTRTLVALALLVLVGAATVWKMTRRDPHVRAAAQTQPLSVKKEDVDELEIAEAGKPAVSLKKQGTEWRIEKPVADRADQKAVEAAVEAVSELKLRDVIAESPESYDKVGLGEKDVVKVIAKKAGKPLATLLVGKSSNVRLDGDARVYSTSNLKRWALVKEPKLWRDRQILDLPVDGIEKVQVDYPAGKLVAKKESPPAPPPDPKADPKAPPPPPSAPAKWVLIEGADKLGGALDENVPMELTSTLARLMADDFADDKTPPASVGLEPPRFTVTVTAKDGKSSVLLVGKEEDQKVYVKLKDGTRIWKIHKWEADRIPGSPAQWRDKTLLRLEPGDVSKIEVVKEKDKTVLERVDDKTFKVTTPASATFGEVDQTKVQALLRTTQSLRATKVLDGMDAKSAGLDKPKAVVTLWKKDGSKVTIALGAEKDGNAPVQVNGGKDIYELPSYQAQPFIKSPAEFKKSETAQAPPG